MYIVGDGSVSVINYTDRHRKELILVLQTGSIFNEQTALYGNRPQFTYQSKAYTTLAMIRYQDLKDLQLLFPKAANNMQQTIMNNPYDLDRNFFVLKCRQCIPYFKNISEENLKKIYFECETKIYEHG